MDLSWCTSSMTWGLVYNLLHGIEHIIIVLNSVLWHTGTFDLALVVLCDTAKSVFIIKGY